MDDKNIQFRGDLLIGSECIDWALLPVVNTPKEVVRGEKSCPHTQMCFIFCSFSGKCVAVEHQLGPREGFCHRSADGAEV